MFPLLKFVNRISSINIKRTFITSSNGLMCPKILQDVTNDSNKTDFTPVFKTSYMPVFIGLNRLKKLQTTAVSLIVPSCVGLNLLGYLSFVEVFYVSSIGIGLTAGLHVASWILSNNLVVFIYLSKDEKKCRMSYISYWGDRSELFCDIEDIESIECSKYNFLNHKIKLKENKNTLKICLHQSIIFNNAKLRKILGCDII